MILAICKLLTMGSFFNKSPGTFAAKKWKEYVISVLCWWGPAGVDCHWCGGLGKIIDWLMVMMEGLLKKKAQVHKWAIAWDCLNVPIQSAHEWKLSINKQARLAIMTSLWGKDGGEACQNILFSASIFTTSSLFNPFIPSGRSWDCVAPSFL